MITASITFEALFMVTYAFYACIDIVFSVIRRFTA